QCGSRTFRFVDLSQPLFRFEDPLVLVPPIVFEDRQIGESKINLAEVIKAIWIILRLFFDRILRTPVRRKPEAESGKP
ncbi:MAG TPA: hypothetical protein VLA12_15405, partial [Planctomycetaceae bacterium]|nr:hypothetical protein [Planctomycetaceae bacterium]